MVSGVELIAKERERQINKEGFNWRHDDSHDCHQLSDAAIVYAAPAPLRYQVMNWWPWDKKWLKEDTSFTTAGRIKELTKAGALIAAEIDRLQRTIADASKQKESEDERIRKEIIEYLTVIRERDLVGHPERQRWITYLEKQKEQKPVMIQWTGKNLKEVIDFTGKSPKFGEWFNSWADFENYVHSHDDILKLFCEDGSHYEVPVGAWIVKTPDGYNIPSRFRFIQKPAEWSEEDDWKRKELIQYLEEKGDYRSVWMTWLKSLRPLWKPSEEQMDALCYALQVMNTDLSPIAAKTYQGLQEIQQNLRKLM